MVAATTSVDTQGPFHAPYRNVCGVSLLPPPTPPSTILNPILKIHPKIPPWATPKHPSSL